MNKYPQISIIIPALNSAEYIEKCLNSIKGLDYPPHLLEFIVVDNGSTDDTIEIAKGNGAKVLVRPDLNVGGLRNFGASRAKGEILAHTDSDCILPNDWLKEGIKYLVAPGVGAVGGGCIVLQNATLLEKAWVSIQKEPVRETEYLPACNFIISRKTFFQLGGFNEQIIANEDDDLSCKLRSNGSKLLSIRNCYVTHLGYPKSLLDVLKRQIWHGESAFQLWPTSYKMVTATVFFLISVLILLWLVVSGSTNFFLWLLAVCFFCVVPFVFTMRKILISPKNSPLLTLILFAEYTAFFLGRSIGLVKGLLW